MPISDLDIQFTRRALELAAAGTGLVSPNPLVGCVIVASDGAVVGEGTYVADDVIHAEAVALEKAGERARGGTAYVSLEPHDHHGKTPPCTTAVINAGISRIVCPIQDPNPRVLGRGFETMRLAGIEVVTGILSEEASRVNEKFICWHNKGRPFVHLKLAMSLDGRISLDGSVSTALSGDAARARVHELRHENDAILVGGNTAFVDDPSLTDRSRNPRRRPMVRVVLDNRLQLSPTARLATTAKESPTLVFTNSSDHEKIARLRDLGVEIVLTDRGGRGLQSVLNELKDREIQSLLVEGGSEIAGAFVDARLVDKVTFIMTPIVIGGRSAPMAIGGMGAEDLRGALRLSNVTTEALGEDIEVTGYPQD